MKIPFWKLLLGVLILLVIGAGVLSSGENYPLELNRAVPTRRPLAELATELGTYARWQGWLHGATAVQPAVPAGATPRAGDVIEIPIGSKANPWKHLTLKLRVIEFEPGRRLRIAVEGDSKGKLQAFFEDLQWDLEIGPIGDASKDEISAKAAGATTLVRGRVTARTRSWRARLFGQLTPKILLNQAFYPDLLTLAGLKEMPAIDLTPRR